MEGESPKSHTVCQDNPDLDKLLRKLRGCGFHISNLLVPRILQGDPWTYVPIYQYLFYEYKKEILCKIVRNITPELFTNKVKKKKTSVEAIYKILRDVFSHTPHLTKDQFMSQKFSKHKVTMCLDVLEVIHDSLGTKQELGDGPDISKPQNECTHLRPCLDSLTGDAIEPPVLIATRGSELKVCTPDSDTEDS